MKKWLPGYLIAVWPDMFGSVFGPFAAKLGPKIRLDRRGSSCSAGYTKNQPSKLILRTIRGTNVFRSGQTAFRYPGWPTIEKFAILRGVRSRSGLS